MPTIYKAKLDGTEAVRYFHIHLVSFYLKEAFRSASEAKNNHVDGQLHSTSVSSIIFSAMAIESFVNELSEDIVPNESINDFIHLRKLYKKNKHECSVAAKYRILLEIKHNYVIDEEINDLINEIFSLRNGLVHYKLSETAGKHVLPPVEPMKCGDGTYMTSIDFMVKPVRIEAPFLVKINAESAVKSYNSALRIITKWGELLGDADFVKGFDEINYN